MIDRQEDKIIHLPIPAYSSVLYGRIYNSLTGSMRRDSRFSSQLRCLFQYNTLVDALLRELKQNQQVLQMGAVFGRELDEAATRIGAYGLFDVIDINSFQVSRNREKYGNIYPGMHFFCADAATFQTPDKYDCVICFLLLQELPPHTKHKVINNALNLLKEGGKAVFIDYNSPALWHPLRYAVRMYNRLYHPFAEKLWDREIDTYVKNKVDFTWRKSTYFGGMFQKLVVTRKGSPLDGLTTPQTRDDFFESEN